MLYGLPAGLCCFLSILLTLGSMCCSIVVCSTLCAVVVAIYCLCVSCLRCAFMCCAVIIVCLSVAYALPAVDVQCCSIILFSVYNIVFCLFVKHCLWWGGRCCTVRLSRLHVYVKDCLRCAVCVVL